MDFRKTMRTLGPGLLWAGAAVGVSHLVQSTRAGANYGFALVGLVLLANVFKYPFFEFAPRYASATGKNLLQGYRDLGKWAIPLYFVITILTMFTIQAAVTVVTGSLFASIFGVFSTLNWTYIFLVVGALIVYFANYKVLDKLIKYIIVLLALSAIVALLVALSSGYSPNPEFAKEFTWSTTDIVFLIALAGWMPSAIDISVWHSVWTIAKQKTLTVKPTVKESLFDFNVGYFGTAILSLVFLGLGALVMYGSGQQFSPKGAVFAGQLIDLFTSALGSWSYPLIAVAALTTMVSTTLTVLDAIPRVLSQASQQLAPSLQAPQKEKKVYLVWLVILVLGSSILLMQFMSSMKLFIDVATILSFLTAPILGWMNFKVVTSDSVPKQHRPPLWLHILSYVGLVVLFSFSGIYIFWVLL